MDESTKFSPELSLTTTYPDELREKLAAHHAEEVQTFTEGIVHKHHEGDKRFSIWTEGREFLFTKPAYFQFCSFLGIPYRFANRIPNDLLRQCVDTMLGDNNAKVKLIVRDKNIVSAVHKPSYTLADPMAFLEASERLFKDHLFREASLSDFGTSFFFEPQKEQSLTPNPSNPQDRFNVGISFGVGHESGLLQAYPYSLRHCCINIAITPSNQRKYNLVEQIRKRSPSSYYYRLLENYSQDHYQTYFKELSDRIGRAMDAPFDDIHFYRTFTDLKDMLGKEVANTLIGVDNYRSKEILDGYKFRMEQDDITPVVLDDIEKYWVFNSITAAAKGYTGLDRIQLQKIGGNLL